MKILTVSDLRTGMVLGLDLVLSNNVIVSKDTLLSEANIDLIKRVFTNDYRVWVLDLVELRPKLLKNNNLVSKFIEFIINTFRTKFTSTVVNKAGLDELLTTVRKYLDDNRSLIYEILVLKDTHCYTYEHSLNVAMYSLLIGLKMELTTEELKDLFIGCVLHDLGKCSISSRILDKPDKLTENEFKTIQQHPIYGMEASSDLENINDRVIKIIGQHHEKLDGSGYPYSLASNKIHHLSRITTVADIFDAVVSKRAYHAQRSAMDGLQILHLEEKQGKVGVDEVDFLTKQLVIFPVNTMVTLSNNKVGFVIEDCSDLYPKVLCIENNQVYDLEKRADLSILECF